MGGSTELLREGARVQPSAAREGAELGTLVALDRDGGTARVVFDASPADVVVVDAAQLQPVATNAYDRRVASHT
jgi:hypothetical protein